ncbi:diaminopimelate decarboxylase [Novosphingobium sp. AP12]|uniref:diaminopimelate decarboxylase n=1 Tax=Novosphingobium sp. AP12 TaxID=1144305 RepID=UPI000271D97E|nr:diaminopimelate decarboxylase [Novosphingobium sp. AP12]EJL20419.1 diaminopimelate decarboxylase [Novosphingobium sp. AP12]
MKPFHYKAGVLHADAIPLNVIADTVGTPAYVYSATALRAAARRFYAALAEVPRKQIAFAVKANPNRALLHLLANEGYGGDIVSGGELVAALDAGMAAETIIYSGTGKTRAELAAALGAGIGQFNIELEAEGQLLASLAIERRLRAPATLRINPDIDARTHAKITTGRAASKFGVPVTEAIDIYDRLAALPGLDLRGIAVHIGSQIVDLVPLEAAYERVGELLSALRSRGHVVTHVDLGGGLGVSYRSGEPGADIEAYGAMVERVTRDWNVTLQFEPGRLIVAEAGVLLTRVTWIKPGAEHPFVIVDAAMNDLMRPALYDAWHDFAVVRPTGIRTIANIVGPVCETGDTFAQAREIDQVEGGDLAVLHTAGAYGATMASTYNCRALPAEVLVDEDQVAVIAERVEASAINRQRFAPWQRPGDAVGSHMEAQPGIA